MFIGILMMTLGKVCQTIGKILKKESIEPLPVHFFFQNIQGIQRLHGTPIHPVIIGYGFIGVYDCQNLSNLRNAALSMGVSITIQFFMVFQGSRNGNMHRRVIILENLSPQ
jgi:hypothetical protein